MWHQARLYNITQVLAIHQSPLLVGILLTRARCAGYIVTNMLLPRGNKVCCWWNDGMFRIANARTIHFGKTLYTSFVKNKCGYILASYFYV